MCVSVGTGFLFQKERITRKVFRYDINAETWKTNSRFHQLNPAFGISHFEFWISHFSNIFSSRHFTGLEKLITAVGGGRWQYSPVTWALMKIEFNLLSNFARELVGVTLVTLLL